MSKITPVQSITHNNTYEKTTQPQKTTVQKKKSLYYQVKYDNNSAKYNYKISNNPEKQMKLLGYQQAKKSKVTDNDVWIFEVKSVIYPLPPYLTVIFSPKK